MVPKLSSKVVIWSRVRVIASLLLLSTGNLFAVRDPDCHLWLSLFNVDHQVVSQGDAGKAELNIWLADRIAQYQSEDSEAGEQLAEWIYSMAYRVMKSPRGLPLEADPEFADQAQELQKSLFSVIKGGSINREGDLWAYFVTAAKRRGTKWKEKVDKETAFLAKRVETVLEDVPGDDFLLFRNRLMGAEVGQVVQQAIEQLEPHQRVILEERLYQQKSFADIAKSSSTFDTRANANAIYLGALKKLRKILLKHPSVLAYGYLDQKPVGKRIRESLDPSVLPTGTPWWEDDE